MINIIKRISDDTMRPKLVAQRAELIDELGRANSRYYGQELPEAVRCRETAKAAALWPRNQLHTPDMAAANIALIRLTDAHDELNARCGRELEKIESKLRTETQEAIDAFLSEMLGDMDATRKKFGSISEPAKSNVLTGRLTQRTATNAEEIKARMAAILEARTIADQELRFIEDPKALKAELAELRAQLPHVPQPKLDDKTDAA